MGAFAPVVPFRLADSRDGTHLAAPLRQLDPTVVEPIGAGGVPTSAGGIVANVTIVDPAGAGYVRARNPIRSVVATHSNANYLAGQTVANLVTQELVDGSFALESYARAEAVVDVAGYFVGQVALSTQPNLKFVGSTFNRRLPRTAAFIVEGQNGLYGYRANYEATIINADTGAAVEVHNGWFDITRGFQTIAVSVSIPDSVLRPRVSVRITGYSNTREWTPDLYAYPNGAWRVDYPPYNGSYWPVETVGVNVENRTSIDRYVVVARICEVAAADGSRTFTNYGQGSLAVPAKSTSSFDLPMYGASQEPQGRCWFTTFMP